jgi:alpha-1,3-rhamnosyl/mannosyltransferase
MTARVAVNLLWMVPGVVGGSEDATGRMLAGVAEQLDRGHADVEVVLAVLPSFAAAHPGLARRFECVVAPVDGKSKPRRVLAETTWIPRTVRRLGIDLVHHAGGVIPPRNQERETVTVHDLQPLDLPGNFAPAKRMYLRSLLKPSVHRAEVVAVPSEFTRGRVIELLGAEPDRVVVVPWATPPPPPRGAAVLASLPARLDGRQVVLYPAITYPHKNHLVLLDAMAAAVAQRPELFLVLIGGGGPSEHEVLERISRPDLRDSVLRLGRVPEATRDALYSRASLVVVPSRYEGFGLPALEAMATGVPVVVADAGALPEVVPSAVPRVGPDDVAGWASAITALAGDPDRRAELASAGRTHAAGFTAARSATAMLGVWERALEAPPSSSA